jgi:lipopolysaccharide heptosyltransferase II
MSGTNDQNWDSSVAGSGFRLEGPLRVLVVRPDRLGDVILSTPVFEVIKRQYSKAHLTVLVKDNVVPVLKGLPHIDHYMVFDPDGKHAGIKGFFRLCTEIRRRHFKIAVVLQSHWKIAAALVFARVKYRVGPLSKFHSYLFYNRGIRQRRSQVEMHEADYNLQMLRKIGIRIGSRNVPTRVHLPEQSQSQARTWLEQQGWDSKKSLIVVHPGMGGSALNWPESHYVDLIRELIQEGKQVLITGGPSEGALLGRLKQALGTLSEKVFFYQTTPQGTVDFLGGLFNLSDLVVAPSTGPLHLAVAIQKPVLTFFSPIRVQSALRWGPYLSDESKASVLVPEIYCGQDFQCLGSLCNYFPCMKSLTVKQAMGEIHKQLLKVPKGSPKNEP